MRESEWQVKYCKDAAQDTWISRYPVASSTVKISNDNTDVDNVRDNHRVLIIL